MSAGGARPRSPYVGLVPYDEDDAELFFGRSTEAAIVAMNLRTARLTILYGPSGVGKSSLLMAGAVHRLRQEARVAPAEGRFPVCVFRSWPDDPVRGVQEAARQALDGPDPLESPAATLAETLGSWVPDGTTLLVVLDQFEEYFQYHPDEVRYDYDESADEGDDERLTGFAAELARIINDRTVPVHVLVSIREDAWAKLDLFEGHISSVFSNYVRVDHLDRDAAREAITGPIEKALNPKLPLEERFAVEDALVEAILDGTATGRGLTLAADGDRPQAGGSGDRIEAPFLQLVLERLWRETVRDEQRTLTKQRLDDLGGVDHIVSSHLLGALGGLEPAQQDAAAACFQYLVSTSRTKLAQPASQLADWTHLPAPEVTAVLDKLCTGDSGRILRAIAPAHDGESESYELFHDMLAEPVLAWRKAHEQEREREAEAARQRTARRRLYRILAVLAVAAAVLAALAGWALYERGVAKGEQHRAESRALAAESAGLLDGRLDDAMMLALAARDRSDTTEARSALLTAVQRTNGLVRFLRFAQPVEALATGPRGTVAVGFANGDLVLLDRHGRRVGGKALAPAAVQAVAFAPVRPLLAAGFSTDAVTLLALRPGASDRLQLARRGTAKTRNGETTVRSIAFSRDGRWLAAGGDGGVTLWRVAGGRLHDIALGGSPGDVAAVAFAGPDTLLAATTTRGLERWSLGHPGIGPRPVHPGPAVALALARNGGAALAVQEGLRLGGGRATALAYDPTGALLASGGAGGSVVLRDAATGRALDTLRGQGGRIVSLAFDRGGPELAVASDDHTVALWDTRVRLRFVRGVGLGSGLTGAAFGRNGLLALATGGHGVLARVTDAGARSVSDLGRNLFAVTASADGGRLAVIGADGQVAAGALKPGTAVRGLAPYAKDVAVADDGAVAAVQADSGVQRWNAAGQPQAPLPPPGPGLNDAIAVAVSPDGRDVAAGYSASGAVVLWRDAGGGVELRAPRRERRPAEIEDVAFDPTGTLLASGDAVGRVTLWHVGGRGVELGAHDGMVLSVAFSPDGALLASGGADGTVRLWDTRAAAAIGNPLDLGGQVTAVAFSPDGRWLVALHGGRLSAWDTTLWDPGTATLEQVRRRFCAAVAGGGSPCRAVG